MENNRQLTEYQLFIHFFYLLNENYFNASALMVLFIFLVYNKR
jgi:hypothetical protein